MHIICELRNNRPFDHDIINELEITVHIVHELSSNRPFDHIKSNGLEIPGTQGNFDSIGLNNSA